MRRKEWYEWFSWRPVVGMIGAALACAGIGLFFVAHSFGKDARVVATLRRLTPVDVAAAGRIH